MDVILVPGLWLDASSWDDILPALTAAGHVPHPMTMPGVGADAESSADVGIGDWVAAVAAQIDALDGDVVLVGHSGGGNVVWGATDARPDRVARVVFVDTMPPASGYAISEFPVVDGVVPFPGWEFFDGPEVADLDGATRSIWAARTQSVPARVPTDRIVLHDPRRHDVPVTILSGLFPAEAIPEMLADWPPFAEEFGAIHVVEIVYLDSGHWPQFSKPAELAAAMVTAIR